MKSVINSKLKGLALCAGFFSLLSCREYDITPSDLIPEVDNVNTFSYNIDSFNVSINHGVTDSVKTTDLKFTSAQGSANMVLLGGITNDPYFGKTIGSFYIQFRPQKANFFFPVNAIMDSAVIVMPYSNSSLNGTYYGDTTSMMNVQVHKATMPFVNNATYYSNNFLSYNNSPIGDVSIKYKDIKDSLVTSYGDTVVSQMRIKLNNSFAQEMLNADTTNFASFAKFRAYIPGFFITVDPTKPASLLTYLILSSSTQTNDKMLSASRMEFYYRDASGNKLISTFPYDITGSAAFSTIKKDRTATPAAAALTTSVDKVIIEGQPGIYTDLTISGIQKLGTAVVNRAQIVITQELVGLDNYYLPVTSLLPLIIKDNGKTSLLAEMINNDGTAYSTGANFVDGISKIVEIDGNKFVQYKFNIPRTIQQALLEGKDSIKLRISGSSTFVGAYRTICTGLNGPENNKLKFNVIFTKK